ncbi:MAG TPA: hypothetical protein VJ343_01230 [archaeon]|nr:hypothetical protein [archaeon]
MKNVLGMLKGKNKFESLENLSILFICLGALILSLGIGMTIFNTSGLSAIMAMMGAFVAFISIVVLIFIWLAKDLFGD